MFNLKSKKRRVVSIISLIVILLMCLSNSIFAVGPLIDYSKKASLTIVKYEHAYGEDKDSTQNVPLKDVEFTIYKLDSENFEKTADELLQNIKEGSIALESLAFTTGEDGTAKFENLDLGRYLVVESKVPKNVSVKIDPFIIDLPRTTDDGTSWNYDVTVYPKNVTVYGDVTLLKNDSQGNVLKDTVWELQVKNGETFEKYDYEGTLTTNLEGKISIKNLPVGEYRLVELSTLEGYILDSSNVQEFTVTAENTSFEFTVINEKPELGKQVLLSNGTYGKAVGAFTTDTVSWKVQTSVPTIINKMDTYYVTDKLPTGIDYVEGSLSVYGINAQGEKELIKGEDYNISCDGKVLTVNFISTNLEGYTSVYFTYNTIFNDDVEYGKAEENTATLTYTNEITVDGNCVSTYTGKGDTAEVHSGEVLIKKVDTEDNALEGAVFKISTTKDNATNGIYVQDKNGNDLVAISDVNGNVIFSGLKYGEDDVTAENGESYYYLTEVESPTYEENGEIKHYNLLSKSVKVKVDKSSSILSEDTLKIVNKKGFNLPITGGIGFIATIIGASLIGVSIKLNKKKED